MLYCKKSATGIVAKSRYRGCRVGSRPLQFVHRGLRRGVAVWCSHTPPPLRTLLLHHEIATSAATVRSRLPDRNGGRKDRKSTRLNSSHITISYAVFCLK